MAKQLTKKSRKPTSRAQADAPTFGFQRFAFKRIVFTELDKVPTPEGESVSSSTVKTIVNARVGLSTEGIAEVQLSVDVVPDPHVQPYDIHVEIAGIFATRNGTPEQLADFCKMMGPTILFPFVRQMVNSLTTDGRYGRVLLRPVNLLSQLKQDGWTEMGASSPED